MKKVSKLLKGSYAFGILFSDDNNLYAMRKDSPLIIGIGQKGNFIASDAPAILEFTNKYIALEANEYTVLEKDKITIYNDKLKVIKKDIHTYEGTKETEGDGIWADIQVKGKGVNIENGALKDGTASVERAKLHINDFYIDIK